jgi:hypothetical protein
MTHKDAGTHIHIAPLIRSRHDGTWLMGQDEWARKEGVPRCNDA